MVVSREKLFVPAPEGTGRLLIVSPQSGQTQWLSFSLLRLEVGSEYDGETGGDEMVAVLLTGIVEVEADGKRWTGRRRDVFSDKAFGVYLPAATKFRVQARTFAEIALIGAPAQRGGEVIAITPDRIPTRSVGQFNWRRDIDDLVDAHFPAKRLLIGETRNPPGNWSSYPPHKHEVSDPPFEARLEEVYHFRISPPNGFAVQLLYSDDGELNDAFIVRDGDTIVIPKGYHPVAAPPGYSVYYLWALAGEGRNLFFRYDPQHEWIIGAERILKEAKQ
jgi:5-deoxy-glucuronate isomerase